MALISCVALFCLLATPASRGAPQPATDHEVEGLIDRLVDFGWNGRQVEPGGREFMAIDELSPYEEGLPASQRVHIDPAMKKLVQMGVRALPGLLAHLSDTRLTKFTCGRSEE